jgi:NAD(P)-dependent dehydrogenase (short-subunit alcohol dehydrogenase family)
VADRFAGKVAVVTGAGRGIGRELALLLAREGASVVVNDLGGGPSGGGGDTSIAQAVVNEIKQAGGTAVAETSSIASMAGGKAVVEAAMDSFGAVDILVNNAGIIRPKRIDEMSEEDFDIVIAVNLKGYFATVRHAAPHMIKNGSGSIVNLSSPSGLGHWSMSNYTAAKEGVTGFTRSVARDLGEFGVRCNAVRPVAVDGSMNAVPGIFETIRYSVEELGIPPFSNRWISANGTPGLCAHPASVIAWLCTPEAAPLNGREVFVFGGHVALVSEPELVRSQFCPGGWSLDALCDPAVSQALTYDIRNLFARRS